MQKYVMDQLEGMQEARSLHLLTKQQGQLLGRYYIQWLRGSQGTRSTFIGILEGGIPPSKEVSPSLISYKQESLRDHQDLTFYRRIVSARDRSSYLPFSFPYHVLALFLRSIISILLPLIQVCSRGLSSLGLGPNPSCAVSLLFTFLSCVFSSILRLAVFPFLRAFLYENFPLQICQSYLLESVAIGLVFASSKRQVSF